MHELAKLVVVWAGGKTLRRRVARSVTGLQSPNDSEFYNGLRDYEYARPTNLVRVREYILLPLGRPDRERSRRDRRAGPLGAIPSGSYLHRAGLGRLTLQRLPGQGTLHVARLGAPVRQVWYPVRETFSLPSQRLPLFVRAVFRANFAEDREIGDAVEVRSILDSLGQPGARIVERAQAPDNKQRLREQTQRAVQYGIFGAPSFVVGEELFWGDDRLEDALTWASSRYTRRERDRA